MERIQGGRKKQFLYAAVVLLLFIFQRALGIAGRGAADILPYEKFDPNNAYAWNLFII